MRSAIILLLVCCGTLVAFSHQQDDKQPKCVDPYNTYAFDSWDRNAHKRLLALLEEERYPSAQRLICEFGMDIITMKNWLVGYSEVLSDEFKSIHQNQHPCKPYGCSHLLNMHQTTLHELAYMIDMLEDVIETENEYRFLHHTHPIYDMLEILQTSQYNALVNVITELEYSRFKKKIDNDDLEDIPEVRALLRKLHYWHIHVTL